MSNALINYEILLKQFLDGAISIEEFQAAYCERFKNEGRLDEPLFKLLDELFGDVDSFTTDQKLLKHFPGHNSYEPGKSILTSDPTKLAKQAGTGQQVGKIPVGTPGSKERVNFGENIGTYIDKAGNASPTTNGMIHYSKDGIHIVPARP